MRILDQNTWRFLVKCSVKLALPACLIGAQLVNPFGGHLLAMSNRAPFHNAAVLEPLTGPCRLPSMGLEWAITGAPGIDYRIEFSEDFSNWQTFERVTNAPAIYPFVDPAAAINPARFYRVVSE